MINSYLPNLSNILIWLILIKRCLPSVPELDELLLGGVELRLGPGVAAGGAAALGRVQRGADEVRARPQLLADLPAVGGDQVGALRNLRINSI